MRSTIKKFADFQMPEDAPIFRTEFFVVLMRPTKWPGNAQYGIKATKKTLKFAADRNLAKRRLRALIREYEHMLSPDMDYVFIVRANLALGEFSKIRQMMKLALKKIAPKADK
jgi:ribonuclease P protein component